MPKNKSLATRIRSARKKDSLSRSQAAKSWGLNERTIESWEQGRSEPKGLYLEKVQAILAKAGV